MLRWKRTYIVFSVVTFLCVMFFLYKDVSEKKEYPSKPISLVVHSKPGSGVDIMARVVAEIAKKKHGVIMAIENRTGAQGVTAMEYVLGQKADGYAVLAVTKSFLSTLLVQKSRVNFSNFTLVANMVQDPEVLVVNKNSRVSSLPEIIADAKRRPGKQVWIGPGTGGRDHLMALKTWEMLGIEAEWRDYKSAPQAALAMLRQEGDVTVGNPTDVNGKSDLAIAAVAHTERLAKFSEIPTFREFGYPLAEYMWRGFAVKKGVAAQRVAYLENLFKKISEDEYFRKFAEDESALAAFAGTVEFAANVESEVAETKLYLEKAGLLKTYLKSSPIPNAVAYAIFLAVILVSLWIASRRIGKPVSETAWIAAALLWLCSVLFYQTLFYDIDSALNVTHPALIPHLWMGGLSLFCVLLIAREFGAKQKHLAANSKEYIRFGALLLITAVYYFLVPYAGFPIATFLFLFVSVRLFYSKDFFPAVVLSTHFVVLCYLVFQVFLSVELPLGAWG
jgi:putative tricarboxylic transport membrane protein